MKKLVLMAVFALPLLFTSCKKEEDLTANLVGTYQGTRTGSCSMVVNGQSFTVPMNASGTATITRISNDRILLNLGGDKFSGTISGDYISFEPETSSYTDQTGTLSLTISSSGTISGSTINIMETYSGQYFIQGSTFPVNGRGSLVLRKQ